MPESLLTVAVPVVAVLGLAFAVVTFLRRPAAVAFADPREERLARRVAREVRSDPAAVLPAVRRELAIAPDQTDDTIAKRAAYHYRRNTPDGPPCRTYRDRAPG